MGFFSNLVSAIVPLATSFLPGPLGQIAAPLIGALTGVSTTGPASVARAQQLAQPVAATIPSVINRLVPLPSVPLQEVGLTTRGLLGGSGRAPLPSVTAGLSARRRALQGQVDPRILQERLGMVQNRGNGRFAVETIVQTTDLETGQVVRVQVFPGRPFLMNSDVRKLRQTAKKLGKANARLPRRTVGKSAQRELIDAVTQTALRKVLTDRSQACP